MSMDKVADTSKEARQLRDYFPSIEDWNALQGGRPRVFRHPERPAARWIVLHVYDEHDYVEPRFANGSVVDTLADRTSDVTLYFIERTNEDNLPIKKSIVVPSFMVNANHGEVCDNRSRAAGGLNGYERVATQQAYEDKLEMFRFQGLEELRFGITNEGIAMRALPTIRAARPLFYGPPTPSDLPSPE